MTLLRWMLHPRICLRDVRLRLLLERRLTVGEHRQYGPSTISQHISKQ